MKSILFTTFLLGGSALPLSSLAGMKTPLQLPTEELTDSIPAQYARTMDEVVVTGQFTPQSLRNSLYKVRTITAHEIQSKAPVNIQSLLNTEVGIRMANDMALGETSFEIMGMGGTDVKILLNGIPLVDRGDYQSSLSQIDVNSVERIEIVEGPMSVVYGTDALAGVVNIITKKGAGNAGQDSWSVSARAQEESVGKEYNFLKDKGSHNESLQLGYTHRSGLFLNGGFTRNNYGGWTGDKTGREKQWHPKDQSLVNGMFGYQRGNVNVWGRVDYLNETIYGPMNSTNAAHPEEVRDQNFETKRFTYQVQGDWKVNAALTINAALSYQDYKRQTRTFMTNQETGEQWLTEGSSDQDLTKYNAAMARLTATWKILPQLRVQPGIEYQHTEGSGDRIDGSPQVEDLAWFLSAEYNPTGWLSIRPGVRSFIYANHNKPAMIPSLLTKFKLGDDFDLRLSYAYGFRNPRVQEMYMSFHDANHSIDGNPDLKAEYSNNLTGSLTWRAVQLDKLRFMTTLSGFYNSFKNRIDMAQDYNDAGHYTYYNINRYKTVGGTLENALLWGGLRANVAVSLVGRYNEYADEATDLPQYRFSPEVSATVGYRHEKTGTEVNMFYKFTGARKEYFFKTGDDGKNVYYLDGLPGYHTADIILTQRIVKGVSLNVGVRNLFNLTSLKSESGTDTNGNPHGGDGVSYLGCGRSWTAGIRVDLDGVFKK